MTTATATAPAPTKPEAVKKPAAPKAERKTEGADTDQIKEQLAKQIETNTGIKMSKENAWDCLKSCMQIVVANTALHAKVRLPDGMGTFDRRTVEPSVRNSFGKTLNIPAQFKMNYHPGTKAKEMLGKAFEGTKATK